MSIQISIPDEASELLTWLIKNHIEGSGTPEWTPEEVELMGDILGKISNAKRRKNRLQQIRKKLKSLD